MKSAAQNLALPLFLGLPLWAQEPLDELHPIQGQVVRARLLTADKAGRLQLLREGAEKPEAMSLSALRRIRLGTGSPARHGRLGFVLLRSGIRLPGKVERCEGENVYVTSPVLAAPLTLSLHHIQGVRFADQPAEKDRGFSKYLVKPKEGKDLLYIKTRDRIVQRTVSIEGFADGNVRYEWLDESRVLPLASLYGLVMSETAGAIPDPQPRPRVNVELRSGGFVPGKLLSLDQKECVVRLDEGVELRLNRASVSVIHVLSDRLVYLTDLTPVKVEQTPAFRRVWKWHRNDAPAGPGIQLGGKRYLNGLVLIPRTRLTYRLDGGYDFLLARIGIEDRSTGPAHAILRVRAGDKILFESKPLTRQSEPVDLKVPIRNLHRLTIEADFGKNYDFGDHCVFAEARLIKQGS